MFKTNLIDRITLDATGTRPTADGYLVANPRVARTGIQLYRGSEIGGRFKDQKVVRVYRPAEEVFRKDSMHSYGHKPLTNDHPPVAVDATNWRDYAVGSVGGEIAKDGECIRVPMVFMDAQAIKDIGKGKKQLSVGYTCDIVDEAGTVPGTGEAFDCYQSNIFVNHIALVKAARGGDRLSVGDADSLPALVCDGAAIVSASTLIAAGKVSKDAEGAADLFLAPGFPIGSKNGISTVLLEKARDAATAANEEHVADTASALLKAINPNAIKENPMAKTITIDGVSVVFDNDQSAQIAERAIADRDRKLADAASNFEKLNEEKKKKEEMDAKTITTLTTQNDTFKAENDTLKQQVKDAEITPAKLDALVADRSLVIGKAKVILGADFKADGQTIGEVKKAVVTKRLGDKAAKWNDEQVAVSFDTLTADINPGDSTAVRDARTAFAQPSGHTFSAQPNDKREELYAKRDASLANNWQHPNGAPAAH